MQHSQPHSTSAGQLPTHLTSNVSRDPLEPRCSERGPAPLGSWLEANRGPARDLLTADPHPRLVPGPAR